MDSSAASSSSVVTLRGSPKKSVSSSAIVGPMPLMLPSSSRSSEPTVTAARIRLPPGPETALVPRQQLRVGRADAADAQGVDEAFQRDGPPRLDGAGQV